MNKYKHIQKIDEIISEFEEHHIPKRINIELDMLIFNMHAVRTFIKNDNDYSDFKIEEYLDKKSKEINTLLDEYKN